MSFLSGIFGGGKSALDETDPTKDEITVASELDAPPSTANSSKRDRPPTMHDIPRLLYVMVNSQGDEAAEAAKALYELSDVAHKHNRVPMVCSGKYDVLTPLTKCLTHPDNDKKLRFVCLTLNNLSVPTENKKIMLLERGLSQRLMKNLCQVVASGKREAYYPLIVLTNLSFLDSGVRVIGQFSPTERRQKAIAPLENPDSLLRILQDLLAHASRGTADYRWAFVLLSKLSRDPENAGLIGLTAAPRRAVENLKLAQSDPVSWKLNTLEDASLFLILHLAEHSPESLADTGVTDVCQEIMKAEGTLQGLKATMVCAMLGMPWSTYTGHGYPAVASTSELMGKTFEREGKKHVYLDNTFRLSTATKAFLCLARASVKADLDSDGSETKTKVVALPTAVAQLFQIVADVALEGCDDGDAAEDDYVPDVVAAEHAVAAIVALLPTLTKREEPKRRSKLTETACNHLIQILKSHSSKAKSIAAKDRVREIAEKLRDSSDSALPVLEASYELWVNYNSVI